VFAVGFARRNPFFYGRPELNFIRIRLRQQTGLEFVAKSF